MLNSNSKNILLILIFCSMSVFTFGQSSKTIAPDFNQTTSKSSGMRINTNLNNAETDNTSKPAQNQITQVGISNPTTETYEKDAVFADRNPKDEVLERRDRTSKHFRNADGSFDAILSTGSVNYFEKGAWLTIERAILPNNTKSYPDYEYANTKNSFKTYLSTDQSKGIKTVIEGQEISEWQNKKIEFLDENLNLISAIKAENGKLNTNEAKAIYSNIFPYTEAHITQLFDGRKIDYEISSPEFLNHIPANSKYVAVSEEIFLPRGWTAKYYTDKRNENPTESKKQISVFNEKGEEVLRYMPPAYFEKNNETDIENPIGDYEIEQVGQILTVKILVEADWLRNENREFPVVIDPTTNVYPDGSSYRTAQMGSTGVGGYTSIAVGYAGGYYRGYVNVNTSSISASSISTVVLYFYVGSTTGMNSKGSELRDFKGDPESYSGWLNKYNAVTTSPNSTRIYITASPLNSTGWKNYTLGTFANTDFYNNLVNGRFTVGFRPSGTYSGGSTNQYCLIYGEDANDPANKPYFKVTYTAPSGPPTCATIIGPANGATGAAHSGNLEWNTSGGATGYDVYFGTSSTPPLVSTNQTGTTYTVGPCLLPNTTYYWRIIPKNASGSATGCSTWSFTTDSKLNIYKNDWETASVGFFGTSGTSVDGWYANNTDGMTFGYDYYQDIWTVGNTGPNIISGKSVGVSGLKNGGLAGDYFEYWTDLGTLYRWIYKPIDLTGLRDVELTFRWKGEGESGQDFGTVASSINGGTNWLTDEQGGLYSNGQYYNSPYTIQTQTLTFPNTRNNQSNFQLAFKWNDVSGNGYGGSSTFVVDDIVMKACPYEGSIKSSLHAAGVFEWMPIGNSQTILTINGSHPCAQFAWEQSTNGGSSWVAAVGGSGANTQSYTTPNNLTENIWYRCKVYFGTGCTGVYQDNPFKIIFSVSCVSNVLPINSATNVSPNTTLTWSAEQLATSYDVYFGTDNPPATMVINTSNTSYNVTNLENSTTYYWRIIPKNASSTASGCDVWQFTTEAAEPPIFHNFGGTEQLTFNNSAYKADNPNFRISHSSTMEEVQIQISQDVTFLGTTVFDGNFTGSFTGENNFETTLEGAVINSSYFPQAFNTNVLTTGGTAANNTWFAPNSHTPIAWTATGGNPDGRVGYSGNWNNYWSNFLRLPQVNCTGQDQVTLTFDVWHSYLAAATDNKVSFSIHDGSDYKTVSQTVLIDGVAVESSATTGGSSYAFKFSELREGAHVEVTFDLSTITNKSNILFYLNATCAYDNSNEFYVYFDNISVTGAAQQFTDGSTYYARTRGKIGGTWTAWSPDTFSFTYKSNEDLEWHQTMAPQFETGLLNDVITATSPDLVTLAEAGGAPANPFSDPSFEAGTSWTVIKSGSWYKGNIGAGDGVGSMPTFGSNCLRLYPDDPGSFGYFIGDYVGTTQEVDLTGIDQLVFDLAAWHKQPLFMSATNQSLMQLRVIIGNQGTANNNSGTVIKTYNNPSSSGATQAWSNEVIDVSSYTGTHTIKFVSFVTYATSITNDEARFYIDNIRPGVNEITSGTLTSTPINLSSFYEEDSWYEFSWNQNQNAGGIKFSIEKENGSNWENVAGFTNFSSAIVGNNSKDITGIASTERIRLKATFSKTGAKGTLPELNSWTVKAKKTTPLPVELISFAAECKGNSKEFTWETASETNSDYFEIMASKDGKNFVPVAEIQAAGHSSQNIKYTYTLTGTGQKNKVYYRLKQIDFDGTSETFNIIHIDCNNAANSEITAYPNPFDGKVLFLSSTSTLENAVIYIYDAVGRLVYQTKCEEISSQTEIKIDRQLEPGAYFLKISLKNDVNKQIPLIVK